MSLVIGFPPLSTNLTLGVLNVKPNQTKYLPAPPDDPQGIRVASVIEFSVCLSVCVFWTNFLISGRRHVIVARVTIEFAAGVNLKTKRTVMNVLNDFAAGVNLK